MLLSIKAFSDSSQVMNISGEIRAREEMILVLHPIAQNGEMIA